MPRRGGGSGRAGGPAGAGGAAGAGESAKARAAPRSVGPGTTVVFTGFRDAGLRAGVEARGGRVASTVSRLTDVVVAGGVAGWESSSAREASRLGVPMVPREAFEERCMAPKRGGPAGALLRLLGRAGPGRLPGAGAPRGAYTTVDNHQGLHVCVSGRRFCVLREADSGGFGLVHGPAAFRRAFVGGSPARGYDGNTMLFSVGGGSYVFVGGSVREIRAAPGDEVVDYVSEVGNSATPYPYAVGRARVYLLLEGASLPLSSVPPGADPYGFYYGLGRPPGARKRARIPRKDRAAALAAAGAAPFPSRVLWGG